MQQRATTLKRFKKLQKLCFEQFKKDFRMEFLKNQTITPTYLQTLYKTK